MSRIRIATLGRPGPAWPRAVARWAAGAELAAEVTTCVTVEEVRGLVSAAGLGAVLVDAGHPGVDRLLAQDVRHGGAALLVVGGPEPADALRRLDPDVVLAPDFDAAELTAALVAHGRRRPALEPRPAAPGPSARLVAVTGAAGAGASTVAQGLASACATTGTTVLADLALDADQHVRHGLAPDQEGLVELAETLRHGSAEPTGLPLRRQAGGYDLLTGLRHGTDWTSLDPTTAAAVLTTLRQGHDWVVADVSAEVDGRAESGSVDLEERNALARTAVADAEVVVVVGACTTTGLHRLARTALALHRHGVERGRIRPLVNLAPRNPAQRTVVARDVGRLLGLADGGTWPRPVCLAFDRRVERAVRAAAPLPRRLAARIAAALELG